MSLLPISTSAQTLAVGLKGGVPITDDLDSYAATSESRPYTVGPMVTLGLSRGFTVEVDALYRRVGYRMGGSYLAGFSTYSRLRGNSWEFPMVLRKSLRHGIYAGAGYAPRKIEGSGHFIDIQSFGGVTNRYEADLKGVWDTTHGVVSTLGIERRFGPLRIAPEARYTYWTSPAVHELGSRGSDVYSNQHQLQILIGVTWGSR